MAGAVGGFVGQVVGNAVGSMLGGSLSSMALRLGAGPMAGAFANAFVSSFGSALTQVIDNSSLPQFMKDAAKTVINTVIGNSQQPTTPEAQDAVNENFIDEIIKNATKMAEEAGDEATGASDGKGGAHWLIELAKALGKTSGGFLEQTIKLGKEIGNVDAVKDPQLFAEKQAEQQANAQMFKIASETTSTVLKSIGEGLSSIARKQ